MILLRFFQADSHFLHFDFQISLPSFHADA